MKRDHLGQQSQSDHDPAPDPTDDPVDEPAPDRPRDVGQAEASPPDNESAEPAKAPRPHKWAERPDFSPPSWSVPSWEAPHHDAPAWQPPEHGKPSWSEPSWNAPSWELWDSAPEELDEAEATDDESDGSDEPGPG